MVSLEASCECGKTEQFSVYMSDFKRWMTGTSVQDAFPYMNAERREWYFLSGTCPECWDMLFGEEVTASDLLQTRS
jgi:hypothetical protein